jgi:DUF4097 and DUF4098 domain-containing protein YvlB
MNIRVLLAAVCVAWVSCGAQAGERRLDKTFTVAPGGSLTVDIEGGAISVTGGQGNQVVVHVVVKGSDSSIEEMNLSAEQHGNDVVVQGDKGSNGFFGLFNWSNSSGSKVTVTVPRRYNVDLKTSGGDIVVRNIEGAATGKTSGGNVSLADITGEIRMHTSGGGIDLARLHGDTFVRTSGGGVKVIDVTGDLDAQTSGGGMRVEKVRGNVRAHTSSGEVRATNIVGDVDLHSSGGRVVAEGIDGAIRADTSGGSVDVELVGANRGIVASTSGGSVTVRVPRVASANVDASTSGGSVSCDLPVTTSEAGHSRLIGRINGGGPLIKARTSGGSIGIRARD